MTGGGENVEEYLTNFIRGDPSFEIPPEDDYQLPEGEYDGNQYLNMTGHGDGATNEAETDSEEENIAEVYI